MSDVSRLLNAAAAGNREAAADLLPLVYDELRKLAGCAWRPSRRIRHFRPPRWSTRRTSGWSVPVDGLCWDSRGHFFAAAAEAMRRILVDSARRKQRKKHGGGRRRVELPDVPAEPDVADERLLALDAALTRLAAEDPVAARVVELRHFAGLSIEDAAATLGLSRATAYRHWTYARAWLRDAVSEAGPG